MWLKIIFCFIGLFSLLNVGQCLTNPCRKGLKATQFLPHPESEEKYIQCSVFGQMFVFSCPPGLVWKQSSMSCDRKSFVSMFAITPAPAPATAKPAAAADFVAVAVPSHVEPISPVQFQQEQRFEQQRPIEPVARIDLARSNEPVTIATPTSTSTNIHDAPIVILNPTTTTLPTKLNEPIVTPTTQQTVVVVSSSVETTTFVLPQQPQITAQATLIASATDLPTTSVFAPTSSSSSSSGDCDTVTVSGSVFNIVNGVYLKLPASPSIYRRSDNLQVPGLIVKTAEQQWCITFSFSTVNFNTLTAADVVKQCGPTLDCCMLLSETNSRIDDPNAAWIVNILDNKGKQDAGITITCSNAAVKTCIKVPFCPPDCLTQRDGCDVCECNGVPFFKIQSNEINQQTQQTTTMNSQIQQQQTESAVQQPITATSTFVQPSTIATMHAPAQPPAQPLQPIAMQAATQQPQMQPIAATSTVVQSLQPTTMQVSIQQPVQQQQQQSIPIQVLTTPSPLLQQNFQPDAPSQTNQQQHLRPPVSNQQQKMLQSQELQSIKNFETSVHNSQMHGPNEETSLVNNFAHRIEAIEKQQLQSQIDQLNNLVASSKQQPQQPQPVVTKPSFVGQAADAQTPVSKIVQTFPQMHSTNAQVDSAAAAAHQPHHPISPQEFEALQSQELLAQQQKQQQVIARQHQEQILRQENLQRQLQQELSQLQNGQHAQVSKQPQRTPGIMTLSRRVFASRLPQPISQMNQVIPLAAVPSFNNVNKTNVSKTGKAQTICDFQACPTGTICSLRDGPNKPKCVKAPELRDIINPQQFIPVHSQTNQPMMNQQQPIQVNPQSFQQMNSQSVQANPHPVQMNPQPIQMNPHPVQMNPQPVHMNPQPVQMNPQPIQMNPHPVQMNPQLFQMNQQGSKSNVEPVQVNTPPVQMNQQSFQMASQPTQMNSQQPHRVSLNSFDMKQLQPFQMNPQPAHVNSQQSQPSSQPAQISPQQLPTNPQPVIQMHQQPVQASQMPTGFSNQQFQAHNAKPNRHQMTFFRPESQQNQQ